MFNFKIGLNKRRKPMKVTFDTNDNEMVYPRIYYIIRANDIVLTNIATVAGVRFTRNVWFTDF